MSNSNVGRPENSAWGTIYVISDGAGMYKIGITMNWSRRSRELEVGSKTIEVLTANVKHPGRLEKAIHAHFSNRRLPQSEWFKLSNSELKLIINVITEKGKDYTPVFEKKSKNMLALEFALQEDPELLEKMLETKKKVDAYKQQRKQERDDKAKRRSGFWGFLG